jgi:membrane protease YdiL (CAAX protease family)
VRIRLVCWTALIGAVAAINYAASGGAGTGEEIYQYATFVDTAIFYALVLGLTALIAHGHRDLWALRVPRPSAFALGLGVLVSIVALEIVVTALPIEDPGSEQGLTPHGWQSGHAFAFALNMLLFVVIAPCVEEATFRGVGQSLWRARFGAWPAIAVIGALFGAWHGLLIALLVLIPFGCLLAWLRERTESIWPGIVVHALFNAAAITVSVL